ncbi:hypothetical protein [Nonomuraea typhae]|uniref:CdiI immunity protein domain-containing protein n=1 Tax=Nonomuraea typhae TaxID=2603600 RepID=A0ABW7YJA4_9ACTN
MTISWRRYKKSGEMFARFNIEHRLGASELIDIVGKYVDERFNDDPEPSKREIEKFIRAELIDRGTSYWTWKEGNDTAQESCEQARELLMEFWLHLADDFENVQL